MTYLYEVQIGPQYVGKGHGSRLLNQFEQTVLASQSATTRPKAVPEPLPKLLMCTVHKSNLPSLRFFEKAGYGRDRDSPEDAGYVILSKQLA